MPYKDPQSEQAKASKRERARRYYQSEKGRKRHREYQLARYHANREAIRAQRRTGQPIGRPRTKSAEPVVPSIRQALNVYLRAKADGTATRTQIYNLVWAAVANGLLTRRPCEVCGDEPTHAHHDDYDRPLDVRWLCPTHHAAAHR